MIKPLVTICIPTYNGEKYILDALNSALEQTYRPIEIVVSDDNSKDNTLKIIKNRCANTDINISIYSHHPQGIGENWNNCINNANGEYIKFLFQDDVIEPNCIDELIKPFFENKSLGLSFCKRNFIVEYRDNEKTNEWINQYQNLHLHWTNLKQHQKGTQLLKDIKLLDLPRNKVGEPTAVLLKKSVFEKVGMFNTDLKQSLDYEFWYRVFTKFDVSFVDKCLVSFRLHPEQATSVNSKSVIADYDEYPKLIYKNCFWFLNNRLKKELFLKYNSFGKQLKNVIRLCKKYIR
ncbi:MAG: glycosyltransferase [Paludibacteraceae bacterium]|nr:glycosyltransferase [Paludibacteraceae bacterium]